MVRGLTVCIRDVHVVVDRFQPTLALARPIMDALPIDGVLITAATPQIGPVHVIAVHQVNASLATYYKGTSSSRVYIETYSLKRAYQSPSSSSSSPHTINESLSLLLLQLIFGLHLASHLLLFGGIFHRLSV